jgi:hypothetical protein
MSIYKTSADLVDKVAAIIGRKVPGEALSAIDHDIIDGVIDDVLAELSGNVIAITDRDQIPVQYFLPIARICAIHSAAEFENGLVDYDLVQRHENRLHYLADPQPTFEVLPSDYF